MSELAMEPSPEPSEPNRGPEKPWKGICCKRCWIAKSDPSKCKCRCHGENHQKGLKLGIGDHNFPSIAHEQHEGFGSPFETRP